MTQDNKEQAAWYQKATRALEFALAESARNREKDETPPAEESVAAATAFLSDMSEKLSAVAIPKVSISANGTITLRWKVSDGRVDVAVKGSSVQVSAGMRSEPKAVAISEVPERVLALLTV